MTEIPVSMPPRMPRINRANLSIGGKWTCRKLRGQFARTKSMALLFRRSPYLVCYWDETGLVFENYATRTRTSAAPLTCAILDFFDRWRPARALFQHFPEYSGASLRKACGELTRRSLLQRSGRKESRAEKAMAAWQDWNPAAGFFHFSTKDVEFEHDLDVVNRELRERAKTRPMPSAVKHYPRARQIPLAAPKIESEFPRVLLARRTWRQFLRRAVPLRTLGELLWLVGRVHRWLRVPGIGRFAFKTSPSGGALHPMEIYVLALRIGRLSPGLYHYASDRHRLELLKSNVTPRTVTRYLPGQPWYEDAAAIFLMTARFTRQQWKYTFARSYRAVLLDAGHLGQTFLLAATWLGLAPFCTMALADSKLERDLGVDGVTESAIFAAGFGTRPPGVDWAPYPKLPRKR
jgi:SagB-type dehydrogenase family enzyme